MALAERPGSSTVWSMHVLVAHENAEVRARMQRLAGAFRACALTVSASAGAAVAGLDARTPDLVLVSASLAASHAADFAQLVAALDEDSALVVGGPARDAGSVYARVAHAGVSPADRQATSELALLLVAFAGDSVPKPASRRRRRSKPGCSSEAIATPVKARLTGTERRILVGIAGGATVGQLAEAMAVDEAAVDGHVARILDKLHRRGVTPATVATETVRSRA